MVKLKGKTLKSVGLVNRKVARMLNDMADMFIKPFICFATV